jgi:hypothetical protein
MSSPALQINHQHQQHPGTFTPGQPLFNTGVSGMASPIHMGPMLSGNGGLATPTVPGRMGNGLNVPHTPVMGMMNFGMGNMGYNMVSCLVQPRL